MMMRDPDVEAVLALHPKAELSMTNQGSLKYQIVAPSNGSWRLVAISGSFSDPGLAWEDARRKGMQTVLTS